MTCLWAEQQRTFGDKSEDPDLTVMPLVMYKGILANTQPSHILIKHFTGIAGTI